MNVIISMLRGINVSGKNVIKMDKLLELYESLDFKNCVSYLQSGNVVFKTPSTNLADMAESITKKIKKSMNLDVPVIIRSKLDMERVIQNLPFKGKDESKIYVTFLSKKVEKLPNEELEVGRIQGEQFSLSHTEIFLYCPNGYGRTKLSNNFLEKKFGTFATTRNWNTAKALVELANGARV